MKLFKSRSKVRMVASVGANLVAGCDYRLPAADADALIIKGYAEGVLSRDYTPDERNALCGPTQTVSV